MAGSEPPLPPANQFEKQTCWPNPPSNNKMFEGRVRAYAKDVATMPGFRKMRRPANCAVDRLNRENIHDQGFVLCSCCCGGRSVFAGATRFCASRRQQTRQGAFRDVLQPRCAKAFRPRDALPALVLVSRVAKGFR